MANFVKRRKYEELGSTRTLSSNESSSFFNRTTIFTILGSLGIVTLATFFIVYPLRDGGSSGSTTDKIILNAPAPGNTSATETEDIIVEVDGGQIRGIRAESRDGRPFLGFYGVPFAKPPIGDLRFEIAEPAEPWEGILNATTDPEQCIQLAKDSSTGNVTVTGSEDCLYLNIFTSKPLEKLNRRWNRFPVIVYIHGGINNGNGSTWHPHYFMDEDVVLVMIQYRLLALGNLNTGDEVARGNFFLKDAVVALEWVQRNIASFGGDKNKVTIYGTSKGAMMVSSLLICQMSKGLFHRAIAQSGSVLHPPTVIRDPRGQANKLASLLQCPTTNSTAIIDCLRKKDAKEITLASRDLLWGRTIEYPSSNPEDTCIPTHPLQMLQNGEIQNVPLITGVTSSENLIVAIALLLPGSAFLNASQELQSEMLVDLLQLQYATNQSYILDTLQKQYFDYSLTKNLQLQNMTRLLSDREWVHPMLTFLKYYISAQQNGTQSLRRRLFPFRNNRTYLYLFARESNSSYASKAKNVWGPSEVPFGAQHADDIQYFFNSGKFQAMTKNSTDYQFSKLLIKLWVNFARNGKPTGRRDDVRWDALDEAPSGTNAEDIDIRTFKWLELTDSPKMFTPSSILERMDIWESFNLTDLYF